MKRYISVILVILLLFSCMVTDAPKAHAAAKNGESRAIAIVFDNSGSMYESSNQAWCRATYAMEVFASMLNDGDVLQIYPMWPITAGNQTYTMHSPLQITDAAQASTVREIFTEDAGGTPIESIACAASGLQSIQADQKYMIVLTDGGTFSKGGSGLTKDRTRRELDKCVEAYAGPEMTVMYLGVGTEACMPNAAESEFFVKKQATNTKDVLSTLTAMCNKIFGRDTLPKGRISGNTMEIDISMSKLIVFVQGENISNLKLSGGSVGKLIGTQQTQYSTKGAGDYKSVPDTSLQGMMVTYEDCAAGTYEIEYTGTASSVEIYYEPDADLDFVFTDAAGNTVNPNALYEGDYKVSFGMKDARTGELISSDLLGNPKYQGSFFINGQETPFSDEGFSGSVDVPLKMGEILEAKLTVTYLSGYTITKDSSGFGWPEGGIQVAARPAGNLELEISGGADQYSLQKLEEGVPYIAKVYYQGTQLTGDELESVDLKWDPTTSNAEIKQEFAEDHYNLTLHYKDPNAPQDTMCGECTVSIYAFYTAEGSSEAQIQDTLTYVINDDFSPLQISVSAPQDYIVISELGDSEPIVVTLMLNGMPLTEEEFVAATVDVDCSGIEHTVTPRGQDSAYVIQLKDTNKLKEGDYPIRVTATHTDRVGRESQAEDTVSITLSNTPLWVKWCFGGLLLLLLIVAIIMILRIRVLPKVVRHKTDECYMSVNGRNVTDGTIFTAKRSGKKLDIKIEYNGNIAGVSANKVEPGKESFLSKPSPKRSMTIKPGNVNANGEITMVDLNGVGFRMDKNGKLQPEDEGQRPFTLTNNATVTLDGKLEDGGRTKKFHAEIPLAFKKK